MKTSLIFDFTVNKENKTISVKREFDAPLSKVWAAWTQSELLDQWWAPKPYQSETKSMDFNEGGSWLYAMVGPDGKKIWCRADYTQIETLKRFSVLDAFCDEQGNLNMEFPRSLWKLSFVEKAGTTLADISIEYEKLAELEMILEMGFKEGFTMGLGNLDELLETL